MDFSTIDLDLLHSLPTYTAPPRWSIQSEPGNGCAGDPPGYPSYFTRSVYTTRGDQPHRGPVLVIRHEREDYVIATAESAYEDVKRMIHQLWRPLPLDHERVKLWIRETYRHHRDCYLDDAGVITEARDRNTFVFPVPSYKLRHFVDDPRFSDAWRTAERAAVDAYNADITARSIALATPPNHSAHRLIARFYPEAAPARDLIANPPTQVGAFWWETEAACPTPDTCRPRSLGGRHPVNGTWCQWCGWRADGGGQ